MDKILLAHRTSIASIAVLLILILLVFASYDVMKMKDASTGLYRKNGLWWTATKIGDFTGGTKLPTLVNKPSGTPASGFTMLIVTRVLLLFSVSVLIALHIVQSKYADEGPLRYVIPKMFMCAAVFTCLILALVFFLTQNDKMCHTVDPSSASTYDKVELSTYGFVLIGAIVVSSIQCAASGFMVYENHKLSQGVGMEGASNEMVE